MSAKNIARKISQGNRKLNICQLFQTYQPKNNIFPSIIIRKPHGMPVQDLQGITQLLNQLNFSVARHTFMMFFADPSIMCLKNLPKSKITTCHATGLFIHSKYLFTPIVHHQVGQFPENRIVFSLQHGIGPAAKKVRESEKALLALVFCVTHSI
ncbi:MAG TPA: hypothetical protein PLI53_03615 [Geobacteraceae bacterium]|nr:hypothetical protein [Geobacteraceae bacterium]